VRRSAPYAAQSPEFDDFLLAPMGKDGNGEPLSVLSALARLNVDPWEEAARLSRLPLEAAARKLAALIAALPAGSSARADPATMAHGLVMLLRAAPAAQMPSSEAPSPIQGIGSRAVTFGVYYLIALAFLTTSHWIVACHSRTQAQETLAPVSITVFRQ
jgi:hypothetical protein